jgi:branched-chain amino acid transport system substrate-binding protein
LPQAGVYRLVVPVEARARALARIAYERGAREVVILAPAMSYGTKASQAFTDELGRLGGHVGQTITYPKGQKSFTDEAKKLKGLRFDAVFVADSADSLELIAPQLAVVNLVVAPPGAKVPKGGRAVLLLSTAEGLAPRYLRGSGRYSMGAIFAPGFYPDESDPVIGPYVKGFRAAYGSEPTVYDAYAADAVACIREAVGTGATTRAAVTTALGKIEIDGLTGTVKFDAARGRADTGRLFTVDSNSGGAFIRALP